MSIQALETKSNNASHSVFGWDFQSNAAIVLMLENIKDADKIKVEGSTEDIELTLKNGKVIYSQAKSSQKPDADTNVITKLQKALKTLSKASNIGNHESLIFATNSPNPFNDKATIHAFTGRTKLKYNELPETCQNKIQTILTKEEYTIDTDSFKVYVIPFVGDDPDNRYKIIKEIINEFLTEVNLGTNAKQIMELWQKDFFFNSTVQNTAMQISKKDMMWGLVTCACDFNSNHKSLEDYDEATIEEIERCYKDAINNKSEQFEFITKVLSDFNSFDKSSTLKERCKNFANQKYTDYLEDFQIESIDNEVQEILVKTILNKILDKRILIDRIKKGVNL